MLMADGKRAIYVGLACLIILVGVVALIAYVVLCLYLPDDWLLRGYAFNVWSSIFLLFFGIQALLTVRSGPWFTNKVCECLDILYSSVCLVSFFVCLMGFSAYGRWDLGLGYLLLSLVAIFNIVAVASHSPTTDLVEPLEESSEAILSCCRHAGRVLNALFRGILLICVLMSGISGFYHGLGTMLYYPSDPKFLEIQIPGNRIQRVQYVCEGNNTELPTMIFESHLGNFISHWHGIREVIKARRHRICIWDSPGLGWSQYLYADQADPVIPYQALVAALKAKEPNYPPPFIGIGWGSGGATLWRHALDHKADFDALIMYEVTHPGEEFRIHRDVEGLTEQEHTENVEFNRRWERVAIGAMNALGVPLAVVPLYFWAFHSQHFDEVVWNNALIGEATWHMGTEATWITRSAIDANEDRMSTSTSPFSEDVDRGIDVYLVYTELSPGQLRDKLCPNRTEEQCQYTQEFQAKLAQSKANLIPQPTRRIPCAQKECGFTYGVFESPKYLIDIIYDQYRV